MEIERAEIAIIGAGPAGSLAAAQLARGGRQAIVLERAQFPRPAIGESLLPVCNELLANAGLLDAVAAEGFMVKHGATFLRGETRERFAFADALAGDTPSTWQVPRDRFDQILADGAAALGASVRFGREVTGITFEGDTARLRVRDIRGLEGVQRLRAARNTIGSQSTAHAEQELRVDQVLDCSGPAQVLPHLLGLVRRAPGPARIACFTQVAQDQRPTGDQQGDIWVCCHPDGGWTWIIPFADGRTSVGFVCDAPRWDALPGPDAERLQNVLATDPNVASRLGGAIAPRFAPRVLRNYATQVSARTGARWALIGHAGEFIDPVLSSGVALSMLAADRASRVLLRTPTGQPPDWQDGFLGPIQQATDVFRAFVDAWYAGTLPSIFFAAAKPARVRRRITSILGGYALRTDNPLARDPERALATLARYSAGDGLGVSGTGGQAPAGRV